MLINRDSFADVIADIDRVNANDPRVECVDGQNVPKELLYSQRMSERLEMMYPEASETLRIAARAQHIQRWTIPRDHYPSGRSGYHAWRQDCQKHHATLVSEIMSEHGYSDQLIQVVGGLIQKKNLKSDPDSQKLENIAGMVFVEHYLETFRQNHHEGKLIKILKKTTAKMSEDAVQAMKLIEVSPGLGELLRKALS